MRSIVAVLAICIGIVPLFAQGSSAERQIRDQISKYDTAPNNSTMFDKDAVFWSGAYAKPQPLSIPTDAADVLAAPDRKNFVHKTDVQRIVVAKADDMAYEYSTFILSFDDGNGHQERKGALLRVWRQTGTEWKIAAVFQRSYGRVIPVDAPAQ